MNVILAILTILGLVAMYAVSRWNTFFFQCKNPLECPIPFSTSAVNRLAYWAIPLGLFFASVLLFNVNVIMLVVAYFLSMELGKYSAKRKSIQQTAQFLVKEEGLPFQEAQKKAKGIRRNIWKMEKMVRRFH